MPYDEPWCRPQNDGPALRAMALCKYGTLLLEAGEDISRIWDIVTFDLEWVLENWDSNGYEFLIKSWFPQANVLNGFLSAVISGRRWSLLTSTGIAWPMSTP